VAADDVLAVGRVIGVAPPRTWSTRAPGLYTGRLEVEKTAG
jgi:hypothetical protein